MDRMAPCMEVEMLRASWTVILCGAVAAFGSAPSAVAEYQRGRAGHGLSVRWIGQDGHDYVTTRTRPEPDDKQDIHLALAGIDPRREITFVEVSVPWGHRWQYNGQAGNWAIELQRNKGATVEDLIVAPDRP